MTEQEVGIDSVEFLRNAAVANHRHSVHGKTIMGRECAAIQAPIFDRIADELEASRSRLRAVEAENTELREGASNASPRFASVSRDEFLAILNDIAGCIKSDDSMEGSLRYEWGESKGQYRVEAVYRIGNSMGQGGSRWIHGPAVVPSEERPNGK